MLTDILGRVHRRRLDNKEERQKYYGNLTSYLSLSPPTSIFDIFQAWRIFPVKTEHSLASLDNQRFDFIGGGISGVTSAYVAGELARFLGLHWEIHVWDRLDGQGLKSTKDSAARIRTSMFGSPEEIIGNLVTSIFFENLESILKKGAQRAGRELSFDVHTDVYRCGYLWLFENDQHDEAIAKNKQILRQLGIPTFVLSTVDVAEILMPGVNKRRFTHAYFCPTDAYVSPTNIVNAIYRYAKEVLHVQFHFEEEIDRIDITTGHKISFTTKHVLTENKQTYQTDNLGITAGACSKVLGERIVINSSIYDKPIPVIPRARQITYLSGFTDSELIEFDPFTIFMGQGAYFSRESPGSRRVMFAFANNKDPEILSHAVFNRTHPTDDYFCDVVMDQGRLDGIHCAISLNSDRLHIVGHGGNLYGETVDGHYLVGLLRTIQDAGPTGRIGINAAHNGHGIMSSLGTATQLVCRLAGIFNEESRLHDPSRIMSGYGTATRI